MSQTRLRPTFTELPLSPNDPPYSAWGLWGVDEEVGTLNLLDKDTVTQAAREIELGHRFSLNQSIFSPRTPQFRRDSREFSHTIYQDTERLLILEDELHFNTQKSSQTPNSMALGIHKWHDHGVFAGRGVLIDYWAYAERHGKTYDATDAVAITYDELMACLAEQSQASIKPIEVRKGDILLVRSGFTRRYLELSDREEREHGHRMPPKTCGVAQDQRMLQFLWEKQVAVVGGDAAAWECLPPVPSSSFLYHEVLLAGWGCPIGELLWLEDLALACDEHKKWTFFLTSAPLNVPGGVASPANMVAIL